MAKKLTNDKFQHRIIIEGTSRRVLVSNLKSWLKVLGEHVDINSIDPLLDGDKRRKAHKPGVGATNSRGHRKHPSKTPPLPPAAEAAGVAPPLKVPSPADIKLLVASAIETAGREEVVAIFKRFGCQRLADFRPTQFINLAESLRVLIREIDAADAAAAEELGVDAEIGEESDDQ